MSYQFYSGYDLIKIKPRGPLVKRAKYRLTLARAFGSGKSQSHKRKLRKQWENEPKPAPRVGVEHGLGDMIRDSFRRGVTIRKFPGGERMMIHRWRKDQMKGVTKTLGDLAADNVMRNNSLLRSLMGKQP